MGRVILNQRESPCFPSQPLRSGAVCSGRLLATHSRGQQVKYGPGSCLIFLFFFFQDLFIYLIYFWPCWVFIAVCRLLAAVASLPVENRLQSTRSVVVGLVTLRHVGSSQTRDQTCVPCIGKQFLNLWTTSEAPSV